MDIISSGLGHRRDTKIFTAIEASAFGMTPDAIRMACRAGQLRRLARGTYVDSATWDLADPVRRHLLMTTSHCLTLKGRYDTTSR